MPSVVQSSKKKAKGTFVMTKKADTQAKASRRGGLGSRHRNIKVTLPKLGDERKDG